MNRSSGMSASQQKLFVVAALTIYGVAHLWMFAGKPSEVLILLPGLFALAVIFLTLVRPSFGARLSKKSAWVIPSLVLAMSIEVAVILISRQVQPF